MPAESITPTDGVGTDDQVTARAVEAGAEAFAPWQDDIASAVSNSGSPEQAAAKLEAWATKAKSDDAVKRSIYQATLLAWMTGALQVRVNEVPEAASSRALARFALAADGSLPGPHQGPSITFAQLPFDEAIADFLAREIVTPEEFARMDAAARQRAFTAAGLATDALRDEAYQAILAALEEGTTLREFARELRTGERSLGITPSDPAYLETVFRTNIASAYNAGRLAQMSSPTVLAARPFVQFRAILDGRTTSRCRYCNGLIFNRQTDPGWVRFAPPLHFNCRSTTALLPASRVSQSQIIHSSDVDPRGYPQEGFGGAPSIELVV